MKKNIVMASLMLCFAFGVAPVALGCQGAGDIPIQHHGRIKPFVAFAEETLQSISGKKTWQDQEASAFLLSRLDKPEQLLELAFIRIDHPGLKKVLGLSTEEKYFSYQQVKPAFNTLMALSQGAQEKRGKDLRPLLIEQQAEALYGRLMSVDLLMGRETITVVPMADGKAWLSPYQPGVEAGAAFKDMARDYAAKAPAATDELKKWIVDVNALLDKGMQVRIKMEAVYYRIQPFYFAWILYFVGFLCLMVASPAVKKLGKVLLTVGFLFHSTGLLLRALVLLRPPVANMYETMIFMDWVLMLCVGVFVLFQKRQALLSSGALVSAMVMLYANLLPVDKSLDVLAPVLQSSYWLTIHVITIISSYSFFAFAMAVAHRHLFLTAKGNFAVKDAQMSAQAINRLLQVGLILLGAGTILGGVWANEAWGRFWGWDPKETWAFITFLGYMAIVHLRYSRKLSDFALAVCSILGFLLVIMTWYGVNFVLGRGMHSYGAGSGGLTWIIAFVIFEACFLLVVAIRRKDRKR